MRLLHLGDLHLGKAVGGFDLVEDQRYILDEILKITDEKSVDAVLIAGDVYDKSVPSEAATKLLDYFLNALVEKKVTVFMISGNHDSDDRLNFGSRIFKNSGIFISAKFDGHLAGHVFRAGGMEINVYLLPFIKASQVKHYFPEEIVETYEDAVKVVLKSADIDEKKCNLLVAHQFVAGKGSDPVLGGSEGIGTKSVGLVEKIGYDLFDKFDYAALGHIHSPQSVGREAVRYSGSPLKYSLSEAGSEKSVPLITIREKNDLRIELVPLQPKRDMRHIKGKLETLLKKENVTDPEDFMYVTLTDEDIIDDAMGIIQQTYPNTIKIDYENSHTREAEQAEIVETGQNKSFQELIREFYQLMYDCDMSEEEEKVMEEAGRKAGVIQ